MGIRYIKVTGDGQKEEINGLTPVAQPPPAPAPQQPIAPPVNLNALSQRKQALQAELNATAQAETQRLNAEAEAALKLSTIQQKIADLERAEGQAMADTVLNQARAIAAESPQTVAALHEALAEVVSSLDKAYASALAVKRVFDQTATAAQQAMSFAASGSWQGEYGGDRNVASNARATVLNRINPIPLYPMHVLIEWAKKATTPKERATRSGVILALTGEFVPEIDKDYSATTQSTIALRDALG